METLALASTIEYMVAFIHKVVEKNANVKICL